MAKAWVEQKERSNPFTLKLICWIAQNMPRVVTRMLLWPITLYFVLLSPQARFASHNYLRRITGLSGSFSEIFKHFHTFSSVVLDRVYFLTDKYEKFKIDVHDKDALSNIELSNRGAILLGAHVGSFEAMRCLAIRNVNLPLKILMYKNHNAMITKVLDELNPEVASSVINLADYNALFLAKESLEKGHVIGMLGDRVLDGEKSVSVKLLGDSIKIPTGPFSLAMMLGVPVIMFFGIYEGGNRYSIYLSVLKEGKIVSREERDDEITKVIKDYVEHIESIVSIYPYNWFNFYNYWDDK